jgi:F-type H+-transporting ATPase subunit gamma
MALKVIKNKIKSTLRTSKVTKAMEAVSAVKMRKSQERAFGGRPYADAALRILDNVASSLSGRGHHAFAKNKGTRDAVIVITSDKGLAGGLNSNVLKEAAALVSTFSHDTTDIICFGKKSYEYFLRRGYTIPQHYLNVTDDVQVEDLEHVVDHVMQEYTREKYRTVYAVYQNFISTFEQRPVMRQLLPVHLETIRQTVRDITPKNQSKEVVNGTKKISYTVEPDRVTVLNTLLPLILRVMLYHALLESKASEHSARMVAMKNATDKAKELTKSLTLLYNKERQSVITAEVSEITGGIEAMRSV